MNRHILGRVPNHSQDNSQEIEHASSIYRRLWFLSTVFSRSCLRNDFIFLRLHSTACRSHCSCLSSLVTEAQKASIIATPLSATSLVNCIVLTSPSKSLSYWSSFHVLQPVACSIADQPEDYPRRFLDKSGLR